MSLAINTASISSKQLCEDPDAVLKNKSPSPVAMSVPLSETLQRLHHLKKTGHISPKQVKDTKKLFE
jgi:hypothetical protein